MQHMFRIETNKHDPLSVKSSHTWVHNKAEIDVYIKVEKGIYTKLIIIISQQHF